MKKQRILLCILFALMGVNALSQNITVKQKNAPFAKVLQDICSQAGYDYFYDAELIKDAQPVTIDVRNQPFTNVLSILFSNQPFGYTLSNRTIVVVSKKTTIEEASTLKLGQFSYIEGIVTDTAGQPIANATVNNLQRNVVGQSNANGKFSVEGKYNDILRFTAVGFKDKEISFKDDKPFKVVMFMEYSVLDSITVESNVRRRPDPTVNIDLSNRKYMNLGQILQGTIPGLSLQIVNTTRRTITGFNVRFARSGGTFVFYPIEQFLTSIDRAQEILTAFETGNFPSWLATDRVRYVPEYRVVTTNAVIPQLRGANSFGGDVSAMLVVIDGFPKEGFPADFPMSNVESIKVIKDPEELIKWGPRAAAGIIMITTNRTRRGRVFINYTSNYYYSPAPEFNRNYLQLAGSRDILDYMKNASDSNLTTSYPLNAIGLNPAEQLINKLRTNQIPQDVFQRAWDSLGSISNEQQMQLLQQDAFSHNHSLSVNGGVGNYQFNAIGNYANNTSNTYRNTTENLGLILNNDFNLLNEKLRMQLYLSVNRSNTDAGSAFDFRAVPPYQLFVDNAGKYVYDYTTLSPSADSTIRRAGYFNHGVNILEDARVNKNNTIFLQGQSRFNLEWELARGLRFLSSLQYDIANYDRSNLFDVASSQARQLINNYGEYTSSGVDFYVPTGGIYQNSKTRQKVWNYRSALSYSTSIGKHNFSITAGGGASSLESRRPSYNTIYGYNTATRTGSPIFLNATNPTAGIFNYNILLGSGSLVYPSNLLNPALGDTSITRNVNLNGNFNYTFDSTFIVGASYNTVLSPNYGMPDNYAVLSTYGGSATWVLHNKNRLPNWMNSIRLGTGIRGNKMPAYPPQITATRTTQPAWQNTAIWVSNYLPVQQSGQQSRTIFQRLGVYLFDNTVSLGVEYNTQKITGLPRVLGGDNLVLYDSARTLRYFSGDLSMALRKGVLRLSGSYNRSPEGDEQFNGFLEYNIAKETYFLSNSISSLLFSASIQDISPSQGLQIMMGTNAASGGGFSQAVNSNFAMLPPRNRNIEVHGLIGLYKDRYKLDLRYYNQKRQGLGNNIAIAIDPATGLQSMVSYSDIVNKGIEFYLMTKVVERKKFFYTITLNGAFNRNIAVSVPEPNFYIGSRYNTAYRSGYSVNNIWSYRWAGLDTSGRPQIYAYNGQITSSPDSATLVKSLVYSGVTRAPVTGGFIHEWGVGSFFSRLAITFNLGHVMRIYKPSPSGTLDNSIFIKDRWRKKGDEAFTDIPAMSAVTDANNTRGYITQNSTNSILPADNIRLQEILVGWKAPTNLFKGNFIRSLFITLQMQNVAFWSKNRYKLDPNTVSDNGIISMPLPKQYSCSIIANF